MNDEWMNEQKTNAHENTTSLEAVINIKLLLGYSVDIWKKVSVEAGWLLRPVDKIINPSFLSVSNAMIFFMAFSYITAIPAVYTCLT